MAGLTALALGASAIGGIGNVIANMSASDRASALQNQALQEWLKVQIPDPEEQKLAMQKFWIKILIERKTLLRICMNTCWISKKTCTR